MKSTEFYAVILSGGSGERFWPLSTADRPKQFLSVFGGKSLIRQAVDRVRGLVPSERILVVTAASLVKATRRELPELPRANIVAEPCRRDTAAAVATACGVVERLGGEDAVAAILTADQRMRDVPAFRRVLADAARAAAATDDIVTMGVAPVITPDDAKVVELPKGKWRDDLGAVHVGPKSLRLEKVPLSRLPRYERLP